MLQKSAPIKPNCRGNAPEAKEYVARDDEGETKYRKDKVRQKTEDSINSYRQKLNYFKMYKSEIGIHQGYLKNSSKRNLKN